ncbi:MAG: SRPBCC family protein [Isosphaeraceae bacterium]
MRPITFSCEATLTAPPEVISNQILDLGLWSGFRGYGPLPGIRSAEFETRTPEVIGTRIRVTDTDGSTHTEEFVGWDPERQVQLRMADFTPPLSRLAVEFLETWEFAREGPDTRVVRSFALYPRSALTRPAVMLISILLKRAIVRHLRDMKAMTDAVRQ